MGIDPILLLAAVILIGLRAFGVSAGRIDFGWLGLGIFVLTFLI